MCSGSKTFLRLFIRWKYIQIYKYNPWTKIFWWVPTSRILNGQCLLVTVNLGDILTDRYKGLKQNYLRTNSDPHEATINIVLWEMGNFKWPNSCSWHVCVKWRWAHSHYKDHIALSYMLSFQRQCNLRQKLVCQCPQSTQLKSNSFKLSLIPSDLVFKVLGSQKEFKNHKRKCKSIYNKSPNNCPGREFYCYWH